MHTHEAVSYGVIPVHKKPDGTLEYLLLEQIGIQRTHWGFPKGRPEKDEAPMDTARREFTEESSITAFELKEAPTFSESYSFTVDEDTRVEKTVTYYIGFVTDTAVTPEEGEIVDYAWLSYDEAYQRFTFDNGRNLLEKAHAYLTGTKS